jgi:hypothetical protein
VFSGVATYWIYRIGDTGAKAVWAPTQLRIDAGERDEGGHASNEPEARDAGLDVATCPS